MSKNSPLATGLRVRSRARRAPSCHVKHAVRLTGRGQLRKFHGRPAPAPVVLVGGHMRVRRWTEASRAPRPALGDHAASIAVLPPPMTAMLPRPMFPAFRPSSTGSHPRHRRGCPAHRLPRADGEENVRVALPSASATEGRARRSEPRRQSAPEGAMSFSGLVRDAEGGITCRTPTSRSEERRSIPARPRKYAAAMLDQSPPMMAALPPSTRAGGGGWRP